MTNSPPPAGAGNGLLGWLKRRPLLSLLVVAGMALGLFLLLRPASRKTSATEFYQVKRGDFTVTVVEGGTLAAVSEISIRNEVEGTARIIWIVPEGTYVKKGDLLVELDSAQAQDQVNQQQIAYEKAKFAVEQAQAQLEIQKSATNSDYLAAVLKVKFAKIDREKYEQGQRLVDLIEASNRVVQAEAQLAVNLDTYRNSTNLAAKGYETKQKGAQRLAGSSQQPQCPHRGHQHPLAAADFDSVKSREKPRPMSARRGGAGARGEPESPKNGPVRGRSGTQLNTLALIRGEAQTRPENLEAPACVRPRTVWWCIRSARTASVANPSSKAGAVVRTGRSLIKLPDLSRMKVTVKIHESHVNMIRPGLRPMSCWTPPRTSATGGWWSAWPAAGHPKPLGQPNLKVYNTEIFLTDTIPNVKPGVSARAEIIVTNIANTLSVPIQAVTSYRGTQAVYVAKGGRFEPKPVEIGLYNTKFIEITRGLNEGERDLLSPPFDTQEKDLERGGLADAEKALLSTNVPPPRADLSVRGPDRPPNGEGAETVAAGGPTALRARTSGRLQPGGNAETIRPDSDGQLDETEREAMRTAMAARLPRGASAKRHQRRSRTTSREEMLRQFDKNGDGELDEEERAALRARFGGRGPRGGGERSVREGEAGGGRAGAPEGGWPSFTQARRVDSSCPCKRKPASLPGAPPRPATTASSSGTDRKDLLPRGREHRASLGGVDLSIEEGSFVAIMGRGVGQNPPCSTSRLFGPSDRGRYWLGGEDVSRMSDDELSEARGRRIGFIFQSYNLIAQ
jgi:HlyD family secretion protein